MLTLPGKRKFKLKRLPEPIIVKETGMKYGFVAPDLQSAPKCQDCRNGFLYIAYGQKDGVYDVYAFPCRCTYPSGYEFWQLDGTMLYEGRPVDHQYREAEMPAYVFLHPVHSQEKLKAISRMVKYLTEKLALEAQEGEKLPF